MYLYVFIICIIIPSFFGTRLVLHVLHFRILFLFSSLSYNIPCIFCAFKWTIPYLIYIFFFFFQLKFIMTVCCVQKWTIFTFQYCYVICVPIFKFITYVLNHLCWERTWFQFTKQYWVYIQYLNEHILKFCYL